MSHSNTLAEFTQDHVETLLHVLSKMFNTTVIHATYALHQLQGGTVGAVYRVTGSAELIDGESIPYNVVLKKQKKWSRHFDPNSWRREYDLYHSGLEQEFTKHFAWPTCYHAELKDDETELWIAYIEGVTGLEMSVEMYARAAKELGRFQGKLYTSQPAILETMTNLSHLDNMKKMYLHYRSWPEVYDYIRADECDIPQHLCQMLIDVDEQEHDVWSRIEQLPIVLCHRDYWVTNIFCHGETISAIDWDTTGWGYLGEDIASLIADEAKVDLMIECYDTCVTAYYEGFSEYSDITHQAEHRIHELILVMFGYRLIEWYKFAKTPDEKALHLRTLHNIFEMGQYR
ncbi:MAG: phosphotransferase [Candidatus Cloacimonadales bacterium]